MNYHCMNCELTFTDFPSANNHEKATNYRHLTTSDFYATQTQELILCSCGCNKVCHAAEAIFDEETDLPYISLEHMAEHQLTRLER